MINNIKDTKYEIKVTSKFKSDFKKISKQNKNLYKIINVIEILANGLELNEKYKNHKLLNNKIYKDCYECHIEPDWLLIYKIEHNQLILLLFATGSHSDLFCK